MTYQNLKGSEDDSLTSHDPTTTVPSEVSSRQSPQKNPQQSPRRNPQKSPQNGQYSDSSPRQPSGWLNGSKGLLIGLGLGLGGALLLTRLTAKPTASAPAVVAEPPVQVASASVTTVRALSAPIRETITISGTVQAFDLLIVSPRASGLQIQTVTVREGDRVEAGQVLAVLDNSVLSAQIEQAQAQLIAAQAQVAQAQAQANQEQASLAEAQERLSRYENLFAQGAISAEELASRRTRVTTVEHIVSAAAANIASAEAAVRSRQADITRLSAQLSHTEVTAPTHGIIAQKIATVGDTAATGSPLFELISGDQLELAVKVPQPQIAQITLEAPVQITSGSNSDIQLQGSVLSIDPTLDPQTRQATVKIGLPNSDLLRPGMFLNATIATSTRQGVVIPAEAAVPQSNGGSIVYTLNTDGTVNAQPVDLGKRIPATGTTPAQIEITAGLLADTPVVVEGASYLQAGDAVDVVSREDS